MSKKKKLIISIICIAVAIVALLVGLFVSASSSLKLTNEFLDGEICKEGETACEVTPFEVEYGATSMDVLTSLEEEGIIKNANVVYYYNRFFTGYSFCAGYFEIPRQISNRDITIDELLAYIANADNAHQGTTGLITFAEGDFLRNYAKILGEETNVTASELLAYWNDPDVVKGYMEDYPFLTDEILETADIKYLLEGYLFPDTYEFNQYTNCDEITRTFLDRTLEVYEAHKDEFDSNKYSIHQIFTLASMVQWESGDLEESKYVAGVFMNRLENPDYEDIQILGSTVTACYAFDLTKEECAAKGDNTEYTWRDDPYNTYTNAGLPPGPVCNPNEISIEAVLEADQSDGYYYFIGDTCYGSGTIFAKTAAQHERNIAKYINCN